MPHRSHYLQRNWQTTILNGLHVFLSTHLQKQFARVFVPWLGCCIKSEMHLTLRSNAERIFRRNVRFDNQQNIVTYNHVGIVQRISPSPRNYTFTLFQHSANKATVNEDALPIRSSAHSFSWRGRIGGWYIPELSDGISLNFFTCGADRLSPTRNFFQRCVPFWLKNAGYRQPCRTAQTRNWGAIQ